MRPSGIITLLTDFGEADPFVGVMKGVILSRFRAAVVVDLAHGVRPQDVAEGAFWLERSFRWFPAGTVHVAVVDPGVGTSRAALVVEAQGHVFVGPDNGLLSGLGGSAHCIDGGALGLDAPSATFHGRDVFAPVAAELAAGRVGCRDVGPRAGVLVVAPCVPPERRSDGVHGRVVSVDRFGNLVTNVDADDVPGAVWVGCGGTDYRVVRTYGDVPVGAPLALVNAFGTFEIAVRDGSAAAQLEVGHGVAVVVR